MPNDVRHPYRDSQASSHVVASSCLKEGRGSDPSTVVSLYLLAAWVRPEVILIDTLGIQPP